MTQPTILSKAEVDAILGKPIVEESITKSLGNLMPDRKDIPLAAAGLGAASAAAIGTMIGQYLPPELQLKNSAGQVIYNAANVAELLAGWGIYKFGDKVSDLVSAFGGGMVIKSIGDLASALGLYMKPDTSKMQPIAYGSGRLYRKSEIASQDATQSMNYGVQNNYLRS